MACLAPRAEAAAQQSSSRLTLPSPTVPARLPLPVPPCSSQREAREAGTPEHVFAREEELDVRAVSHAERAAAHQHTFPARLLRGWAGWGRGGAGEMALCMHGLCRVQSTALLPHRS